MKVNNLVWHTLEFSCFCRRCTIRYYGGNVVWGKVLSIKFILSRFGLLKKVTMDVVMGSYITPFSLKIEFGLLQLILLGSK